MIKVRVSKAGLVGVQGATGIVALSTGLVGCASDPASVPNEAIETSRSAYTIMSPGTGVLSLDWAFGSPSGYAFSAKNSTDEYVRAGETMSISLPGHLLWSLLYPQKALPDDSARIKDLSAKVNVIALHAGNVIAQTPVKNGSWTGASAWSINTTTPVFTIDEQADTLKFEITISDAQDAAADKTIAADQFFNLPVLGGHAPDKTALFDTFGTAMRQRVLEGGDPVAGAELAIVYTDWRAATLLDASSIDRTIGTAMSYGRFGSFEMPIMGELEYEISYGVAADSAWHAEQTLAANAESRFLPRYRTAYEGKFAVPTGAQKLEFYFHIKAFLKVDYSRFQDVRWRKYGDGQRILVREKWDNEHGVTADNYDFNAEKL